MRWRRAGWLVVLVGLALVGLAGCAGPSDELSEAVAAGEEASVPPISVASPFLAAVTRELVGETIPLLTLAEPGMCPGHFDLRPSQVRQAQRCQVVVRFDFQQSLDARLTATRGPSPTIAAVHVSGGMCEPQSYVEAGRQVADALVAAGLLARDAADERLVAVEQRMDALQAWAREQIVSAGLDQVAVMASRHQADFCRSLGLHVVATFPSVDESIPSEINRAVQQGQKSGIAWVVANLPEGRQAADALADRLSAQVVVFGNFPDGQGTDSFDRLVRDNVTSLVKAVPQ
ncbi:MAG: zinc ABC transporter substrate-binding protein [Planctomycetaceae bacterium]|nr:zinc ABC transporter substrate-binding protein [Planctomycetaceae bacterium]